MKPYMVMHPKCCTQLALICQAGGMVCTTPKKNSRLCFDLLHLSRYVWCDWLKIVDIAACK